MRRRRKKKKNEEDVSVKKMKANDCEVANSNTHWSSYTESVMLCVLSVCN
jgi:hypothetical protein